MVFGEYTCTVNGIDDRGQNIVLSTQLAVLSVIPTMKDMVGGRWGCDIYFPVIFAAIRF